MSLQELIATYKALFPYLAGSSRAEEAVGPGPAESAAPHKGGAAASPISMSRKALWECVAPLCGTTKSAVAAAYVTPPTKFWLEGDVAELKRALTAARALGLHAWDSKRGLKHLRSLVDKLVKPGSMLARKWRRDHRSYLQLSFAGRALEKPSEAALEAEEAAFVARRGRTTKRGDPPPVWPATHSRWTLPAKGERPALGPPETREFPMGIAASPASSFGLSRKSGGKSRLLAARGGKMELDSSNPPMPGVGTKPAALPAAAAQFAKAFWEDMLHVGAAGAPKDLTAPVARPVPARSAMGATPTTAAGLGLEIPATGITRMAPLAERGGKVRIATVHSYGETLSSAITGGRLKGEMARHSSLRGSLLGDPDELFFRPRAGVRGWVTNFDTLPPPFASLRDDQLYLFSGDLTAATDTIRHDVLDSFFRDRQLDPGDARARYIRYQGADHPIRAGTDLGLGGSWPTMALLHAYACEEMGLSPESFVIKGDDIGALWYGRQVKFYLKWIQPLTGMAPNFKKTFAARLRQATRKGRTAWDGRLLYCEQAYKVASVKDGTYHLVRTNFSIPLKLMHVDSKTLRRGTPRIWSLGDAFSSLVPREGRSRVWHCQFANSTFEWAYREYGRWVFLPAPLGGLGMVPYKPNLSVPDRVQVFARAVANGGLVPPPRTMSSGGVEVDVNRYLQVHLPRRRAFLNAPNFGNAPFPSDDWADIVEEEERRGAITKMQDAENTYYRRVSAKLESEREAVTSALSFVLTAKGKQHVHTSPMRLNQYLRKCRRLASALSLERINKKLRFNKLNQMLASSLWVPRDYKPLRQLPDFGKPVPKLLPGQSAPKAAAPVRSRKGSF